MRKCLYYCVLCILSNHLISLSVTDMYKARSPCQMPHVHGACQKREDVHGQKNSLLDRLSDKTIECLQEYRMSDKTI